jgi:hypothetical protein
MDAQRADPSAIFDQRHVDQPGNLMREKLLALGIGESRIRLHVVDGDTLAAAAGINDGFAEYRQRPTSGKGRWTVGIGPADDELVSVDVRVIDATRAEMLSDGADGDVLDFNRVA